MNDDLKKGKEERYIRGIRTGVLAGEDQRRYPLSHLVLTNLHIIIWIIIKEHKKWNTSVIERGWRVFHSLATMVMLLAQLNDLKVKNLVEVGFFYAFFYLFFLLFWLFLTHTQAYTLTCTMIWKTGIYSPPIPPPELTVHFSLFLCINWYIIRLHRPN